MTFQREDLSDTVTLYLGDCLDVLPTLAAGSVDAVVTDPPYGIAHPTNYKQRGRANLADCTDYPPVIGDDVSFDPAPFLGWPCLFGGGNYFADRLPVSSGWLVWDKIRPDDLDQSTCELAWSSFVKGVRRFRYLWNGMIRAGNETLYHPTQKPVALMTWVLSLRWTPDGTIFDPYMGAGSTGVAAVKLGRSFIGVEKEPKYYAVARRRILEALAQPALLQVE